MGNGQKLRDELRTASPTTILASVVALSLIGVATGILLVIGAPGPESTPGLVAILAFLAPTILALVALLRQDSSRRRIEEVSRKIEDVRDEQIEVKETLREGLNGEE